MTSYSRLAGAVAAIAATAMLSLPALADARAGERTFQQAFPVASVVCARVSAGVERSKHLRRFATQVLADCATLQSTFSAAQAAVLATRAQIDSQLLADRAAIAATCVDGRSPHPAVCRTTRRVDEPVIATLRRQMVDAARLYWRTLEAARRSFWNAIHALPGEAHLRADKPIPQLSS